MKEAHKTVGKAIRFCSSCRWHTTEEDFKDWSCPNCGLYTIWEIYSWRYYDKKKHLIAREEGLSDGDENDFHSDSLKDLKRILLKGMKLLVGGGK